MIDFFSPFPFFLLSLLSNIENTILDFQILLPLSLLLLCLPLSIQRAVQQFGSCHVLAFYTGK